MFGFFRRSSSSAVINVLHGQIMARARQPAFYSHFGVPDSIEGRFELVTLHAALIVGRLDACAAPGPEVARDLTDAIFAHFEIALRETGVGDIVVPKRMKKLAESYLGRANAYKEALEAPRPEPIQAALARNIFSVEEFADVANASNLARYVRDLWRRLGGTELGELLDNTIEWPEAADYLN